MLQYKNILVPVDFSDISSHVIRKAISAKDALQSNLTLFHVVDYLPPPYADDQSGAVFSNSQQLLERAELHLATLAAELKTTSSKLVVKSGNAKEELVRYIQENKIDLVVMAAHSHSAFEKMLGSTTTRVIQNVQCDVLVVHG